MTNGPGPTETDAPPAGQGWGWSTTQTVGIFGSVLAVAVGNVVFGVDPFFGGIGAALLIAGLIRLRFRKVGTIVAGVLSLAILGMVGGFLFPTVLTPQAGVGAIISEAFLMMLLVTVISTIPAFLEARRGGGVSSAARAIAYVGVGVTVLYAAWALYSIASFEDAVTQEGDIEVATKDFEFDPDELDGEPGEVSVFIDNQDTSLHTFTIDELGVDVSIPPGKSTRVTFQAENGKYRFYCKPHAPDMDGTLEVG